MGTYSIKDLERLSGIKAHTIRIWEKRYIMIEPDRSATNIRSYCDHELKKILNISILNRHGLKISKIAELSAEEIASLVLKLTENPTNPDSQIESLYIAMIDMDENLFEKILSRATIQMGFEQMVLDLLYPFFKRMGIMWLAGTITPAQEHFISNLVRQKIIVAIDSVVPNYTPASKTFMLYLPEKELHELGLLFLNYLLRKRGHRVVYLGAMLPISSVVSMQKIKPTDYLVTSVLGSMAEDELQEYSQELAKEFKDTTIFFTGNQAQSLKKNPKNVKVVASATEFIKIIDKLST